MIYFEILAFGDYRNLLSQQAALAIYRTDPGLIAQAIRMLKEFPFTRRRRLQFLARLLLRREKYSHLYFLHDRCGFAEYSLGWRCLACGL
jgi:hypothetical protein